MGAPVIQSRVLLIAFTLACIVVSPVLLSAQILLKEPPKEIRGLDVVEHLGSSVPTELSFVNSDNQPALLGDYFKQPLAKPTIVALVYYRCPTVCSVVLSKLSECLKQLDYSLGKDFNCLVFSFKEEETTIDAAGAKARYAGEYNRGPEALQGWQFFTGTPENAQSLADALGFQYRRLENGEYSHPVAIFVLTPDGKIARYIYGFEYRTQEMKLALLEASNGKIAKSIGDRFLHFCYQFDPTAGAYTLQAFRVMQIGAVVTLAAVFTLIISLRISEAFRKRRASPAEVTSTPRITDRNAITGMAR